MYENVKMDIENESCIEEGLMEAEIDMENEDLGNVSNEEANEPSEPDDDSNFVYKRLLRKQAGQSKEHCAKEERNATIRKVSCILQKPENERTSEELLVLKACSDIVKEVQSRKKKRDEAKKRQEEFEEPLETLKQKCTILAQAIAQSQHLVIYTGAGISTAARIPDYRGTNGIWTMLQQGKSIGNHDLSLAEPTYTHMALSELYKRNILKYVVSQNCDGLHLRSGLPRTALSEVHGNMYIEVCKTCKPSREYWRLFDVTENTARYSHKTMRKCYVCNGPLNDTIVHFGERGSLQWPLNWSGASKNARKATTIVCLGSSLKVLKKYPWLWQMHKPVKRRPNLYIINLQWTPKDDCANVKIHGKCDLVMKTVMDLLGINVPKYDRENDPIFIHGTHLLEQECHTTTQPFLKVCGKNVPGKTAASKLELELAKREEEKAIKKEGEKSVKKEQEGERMLDQKERVDTEMKDSGSDCLRNGNPANEIEEPPDQNFSFSEENIKEEAEEDEEQQEDEELPINYSNKTPTTNCDTISNIYSINKVPLAMKSDQSQGLPQRNSLQILNSEPQAAHNSNNRASTLNLAKQSEGLNLTQKAVHNNMLQTTLFTQNCQALLTYYQLSNSLLQSSLGLQAYRDMLYPLQTSLLYSGLHSIINPMPFLTEEPVVKQEPVKEETPEPTCDYCYENYKSFTCVFYEKLEPGFAKQQFRFSKADNCQKPIYCLCCDCTTDEEDEENVEGVPPPDKMTKLQEDASDQKEKAKIQPGWYGKGYRKHKKQRRKTTGQY